MPLLAAWMVLIAVDIESSRLVKSLARFDRPWAVKKLIGLSSAELTRLPVASLDWVFVMSGGRVLQLQKVGANAGGENDIGHGSTFLVSVPQYGGIHVTIPTGSAPVIACRRNAP